MACISCDLLLEVPDKIGVHQKTQCPRCKHTLARGHHNPLDYALANTITCFVLMGLSYAFVFISFETAGQGRAISLIQAVTELHVQGFTFLALIVFLFTAIFPLLYLGALFLILAMIKWRLTVFNPVLLAKIISYLMPWVMVDVFLMGVLVALIKVTALASISFGVSFYSYLLFAFLFSYSLALVDRHRLWHWIEQYA